MDREVPVCFTPCVYTLKDPSLIQSGRDSITRAQISQRCGTRMWRGSMALPQQAGNSIHQVGSLASTPVKVLTVSRCLRHGAQRISLRVRVFSRHSVCGGNHKCNCRCFHNDFRADVGTCNMMSAPYKHMRPQVEMTVVIGCHVASGDRLVCVSILIVANKVQRVHCLS